jgi:hypothetical protein
MGTLIVFRICVAVSQYRVGTYMMSLCVFRPTAVLPLS